MKERPSDVPESGSFVRPDNIRQNIKNLILVSIFMGCACLVSQTNKPVNAKEVVQQQQENPGITPQMLAAEEARRIKMMPDELAWEQTLEANLGNHYLSIYYEDKDANRETSWDYVKDNPALPRLLIIGDSISRGYTLPVRHALDGKINVHRAPANCGSTALGLENLDTWLGDKRWDIITWNFGIHDRNTDPAVYKDNLEILLKRLQKTGARIIWVRTTPPPPSGISQERFTEAQNDRLNRIADGIMRENGISEVDLYSAVKPELSEVQLPDNVHFTDAGYELMGSEVAKAVLLAVKK